MNKTKIPWVKNPDGTQGYTWNPLTGCNNQVDGLCGGVFPCWAYGLANTRLYHIYMADKNSDRFVTVEPHSPLNMPKPFVPRFWPEKLTQPHSGKGKGIFTCDMSDLFGIGIPNEWTEQVMAVIKACPQHRFYLQTKQPQNLIKFSPFPDNCYVGVSVTNSSMFDDAVQKLSEVQAKVKYLSVEPYLSRILPDGLQGLLMWSGISRVIIGAQTGTQNDIKKTILQYPECHYPEVTPIPYGNKWTLQPKIEWVQEIVEACDKAGIPVFQKNSLRPLLGDKLRQEMPRQDTLTESLVEGK